MPSDREPDLSLRVLGGAGRYHPPGPSEPNHYAEQLRVATMSLGTYSIPVGGLDDQRPHAEDEIYLVTAGRGRFTCSGETVAVAPGDVVFVPAGATHRFHDLEDDLCLLVVFAPPYSGD